MSSLHTQQRRSIFLAFSSCSAIPKDNTGIFGSKGDALPIAHVIVRGGSEIEMFRYFGVRGGRDSAVDEITGIETD